MRMKKLALEFVVSKLKAGVERPVFELALRQSQRALENLEGMQGRTVLYVPETEQWIDLVEWAGLAEAQRAAEQFATLGDAMALMEMLDMSTVEMKHFDEVPGGVVELLHDAESGACVELVMYKLKPEADLGTFVSAGRQLEEAMRLSPAFVSRSVFRSLDEGLWLEIMQYRDKAGAEQLYGDLQQSSAMAECHRMIDESSVRMFMAEPMGRLLDGAKAGR
ncbi:hypothetical protein ACFFK0_14130 [Paenibacillus chartarius]|uniref:ABM domain-containing protein n=1 Tax=Paenibacillus chartarius TaxID=747481 RepID=A0ABV6DLR2_9BACL